MKTKQNGLLYLNSIKNKVAVLKENTAAQGCEKGKGMDRHRKSYKHLMCQSLQESGSG